MEHLTVLGQMVSFLVSLLYCTFSSLLCSSRYCSPQSGSRLILVSKPTATGHFLLFGPWQMVPRYYGTNSWEVDWNFYSSFPCWILGASVSHTFPSYNFHCIYIQVLGMLHIPETQILIGSWAMPQIEGSCEISVNLLPGCFTGWCACTCM